MTELSHEREVAVALAEGAGGLLASLRPHDLTVEWKASSTDPVSDADRHSEALVVDGLRTAFPSDGMLSEEGSAAVGTSGRRWVVDPLDGTVNYLYGRDAYAVSVALEDGAGPLVGVVHAPATGRTLTAVRGQGAWDGSRRLAVSSCADLAMALLATGFSYEPARRSRQAATIAALLGRVRDIRRDGAAALDLAAVARGSADLYLEEYVREWDVAAGAALVTEAGGVVHRWDSAPGYVGIVAGPAPLVDELLSLLGPSAEDAA